MFVCLELWQTSVLSDKNWTHFILSPNKILLNPGYYAKNESRQACKKEVHIDKTFLKDRTWKFNISEFLVKLAKIRNIGI